jgi:N-acetylneuraminic acid mutarotase
MRYLSLTIIIIASFSLSNCEKDAEVQPKEYPYVITNSPTVNSNGAEFSADLTNVGNQEIIKYGFVWSTESNPTIQDYNKLFDDKAKKGIYSCNVNSGLANGQTYYVRAYILTDQYEVYGNEKSFSSQGSLPPEIDDFEPKFGPIGTLVTIAGKNFALSKKENTVKFGDIEVIVDSVSENSLLVTIPQITRPEMVQVSIETAGMITTSQDSFDLWFPWNRINDFNDGYIGGYPISFSLNNKGYFGLGYNKTNFWEYDPVKDIFIKKSDFPKSISAFPMSFTANNKGYVLFVDDQYSTSGGIWINDTINELWEYNPENDAWTRKADFPGSKRSYAAAFSINEKGYITGGKYWKDSWAYYPQDLWEYDPLKNEWLQKADFPGSERDRSYALSMNGKGYFGIGSTGWSQKSIYEYDPVSDTWDYFTYYPGEGYNYIKGFVINNKCYMGLGRENSDDSYSDFWELDIENKSWKKLHSCPINMAANLSFTINNKGYIGIGWNDYYDYSKIMYEFDPTKN